MDILETIWEYLRREHMKPFFLLLRLLPQLTQGLGSRSQRIPGREPSAASLKMPQKAKGFMTGI